MLMSVLMEEEKRQLSVLVQVVVGLVFVLEFVLVVLAAALTQ